MKPWRWMTSPWPRKTTLDLPLLPIETKSYINIIRKKFSCAYASNFLCIRKRILSIHKRSCACTWLLCWLFGKWHKKGSRADFRLWTAAFLGPWPLGSLAQSMHKSVVHARDLLFLHNNLFCSETAQHRRWAFLLHFDLYSRLWRIRWRIVTFWNTRSENTRSGSH